MKIVPTHLSGVHVIHLTTHNDKRGCFTETFNAAEFYKHGLPVYFLQDNQSVSHKNVLRGIHYQLKEPQGKLVRVVGDGRIFDVAVDLRRSSPTFGEWYGQILDCNTMMYIPAGFGHGFLTLSDYVFVNYKCTTLYDKSSERVLRWDDPTVNINWPEATSSCIMSEKDRGGLPLSRLEVFE